MAGQMNEEVKGKKRPWRQKPPGPAGHSPALVWLSLVGLLASRARLRFARQKQYIAMTEVGEQVHPARFPGKDGVAKQPSHREPTRDATEDYPQSGRTFQVLCVRKSPMGGRNRAADDRSGGRMPARTGGRSARAAVGRGRATTGCRSGDSSSCRCGGSPCTSCMRCGGWTVRPAA